MALKPDLSPVLILLWAAVSLVMAAALVIVNKRVLHEFPFPLALTSLQHTLRWATISLATIAFDFDHFEPFGPSRGLRDYFLDNPLSTARFSLWRAVKRCLRLPNITGGLGLALTFAVGTLSTNCSLAFNTVGTSQALRILSIPLTALLQAHTCTRRSNGTAVSIALILAGVGLATFRDYWRNVVGIVWGLLGAVATALTNTAPSRPIHARLGRFGFQTIQLVTPYVAIICLAGSLVFEMPSALALSEWSAFLGAATHSHNTYEYIRIKEATGTDSHHHHDLACPARPGETVWVVGLSCVLTVLANSLDFGLVYLCSTPTFYLVGHLKSLLIVLTALVLVHRSDQDARFAGDSLQLIGVLTALAGLLGFIYSKKSSAGSGAMVTSTLTPTLTHGIKASHP
ncbi:uncharacterized protein BJ171DRAFT_628141 [Polychytrium aggregatum]|uniref:uncharacterized protein n=1 Tax=Polychytrium aggregatum TaxID=110093 RepID=UPI0022FE5543|nr:uncharacterized protein BJ171DRAFT_628141 [Polychytrium aggregatum]KAI9202279.1 hypothetical protein BJ171DRAFT_628141 [Polychytrium aggregatum]